MLTRQNLLVICCLTLGAMLTLPETFAQPPQRGSGDRRPSGFGGFGGPGGGSSAMMTAGLLRSEQVQKELKLSEDQVKKLTDLQNKGREQMRELFGGLRDKSPEERREAFTKMREKMQELGKKSLEDVNKILTKEQAKRLGEIRVQVGGRRALLSDDVKKELKITEKQVASIQELMETEGKEIRQIFEDSRNGDIKREEARDLIEAFRTKTDKDVQGVLTSAQQKKWKDMQGEKFEFDRRSLFRPRRPGGENGEGGRPGSNNGERRRRPGSDDGERRRKRPSNDE